MNKQEIIEKMKNVEFSSLKSEVVENSSGKEYKALMAYNAMLDNITIGAHTSITFEFAGIEWTLRLLTAEEYIKVRLEVIEECKKLELFDDFLTAYHTVTKVLAIALTPSPFKKEGKAIFSAKDLTYIPYDILEVLYERYLDFVQIATKKPQEYTNEEVEAIVKIVKKKPEVLRDLEPSKLRVVMLYLLNYCENLEKMLGQDLTN